MILFILNYIYDNYLYSNKKNIKELSEIIIISDKYNLEIYDNV